MAKLNAREQFLAEQAAKNRPKFYYATRITVGADNFLYLKSLDKPHIKFQPDENIYGLSCEHLISDLHFAYITWDLVQTINVMRHENSEDVTDYGRYVINDMGVGNRELVPDTTAMAMGFKDVLYVPAGVDVQRTSLPDWVKEQATKEEPAEPETGWHISEYGESLVTDGKGHFMATGEGTLPADFE